ncbi:ornithine--oxo-acid transaminase [Paenibacillus cellulosilyticus]|uniref:ornithine aminotransferase n=1 Tax=Paenibacillus cellulosilyticus TaxID=375489 RepID=A0A2V2Z0U3_9BACL|nr:ornithine--oxo-acid transaminase [Paenibacillus cellulosilyticus]PWW08487.1 ornithine--oxo-acid transaminase [Paenibacillus cellulosilyticus]
MGDPNLSNIGLIQSVHPLEAYNYNPLPIVIVDASGVWVTDAEGERYMDMLSAYSALNAGHRHPRLIRALLNQAMHVTLTSRAFYNEPYIRLCTSLTAYTKKDAILPMNSGAEAIETAIKTARRWGYRNKGIADNQAEIIVCANNFHGRTITAISFSSEQSYKHDFGPLTPGFRVIPYGDIDALEQAITSNTVAFLVEPIQGEAGIILPPAGYLSAAATLCRAHQLLFIADEIQTGFGRTGRRFACDYDNVVPDIYVLGKALGGGILPISAIAANRNILDVFEPGSHGSTFGGNALACAVAIEAIAVAEEEQHAQRSETLGNRLLESIKQISNPIIREVRGRGLFIGIELTIPARPICEQLMKLGLLCKETHESTIRLAPPLTISDDELNWAIGRLRQALS